MKYLMFLNFATIARATFSFSLFLMFQILDLNEKFLLDNTDQTLKSNFLHGLIILLHSFLFNIRVCKHHCELACKLFAMRFLILLGTYIPTVLMGVIYLTLFVRLALDGHVCFPRLDATEEATASGSRWEKRHKRRVTMAKMLIASYVWYCLCLLPGPIIVTAYPHLLKRHLMLPHWTNGFLTLCGYAASPVSTPELRKFQKENSTKPDMIYARESRPKFFGSLAERQMVYKWDHLLRVERTC